MQTIPKCPRCGSSDLTKIAHIPYFIPDCSPTHHCNKCKSDIGSAPLFRDADKTIRDYRNEITDIRYEKSQPSVKEYNVVNIAKENNIYTIDVNVSILHDKELGGRFNRTLTVKEWKNLVNGLFVDRLFHEWSHTYPESDVAVLDGCFYHLAIRLRNGTTMIYRWDDAQQPPYARELSKLFTPFLREVQRRRQAYSQKS